MIGFPPKAPSITEGWERRRPWPLYAEHGMVGAAHPLAAEAGLHILRVGGNAVDAAVAAGLAAAVVMPEMCGLGGDLFSVIHIPSDNGRGKILSVQGSGIAPRNAPIELMRKHGDADGTQMPYQGPLSIAVPGMVDGYFSLLNRFGTMSFAEVAATAIDLARNGYILMPLGAEAIAENAEILSRDPAASGVFLPETQAPAAGTRLRQPGLARTLETLATEGVDAFYRGAIAKEMISYLTSIGGRLSLDDLADHATDIGEPLRTNYRGYTVYQTAIPSQGLIMLEALNIVEFGRVGNPLSVDAIHTMVEAKKLAFADRLAHTADRKFHSSPIQFLLSKEHANRQFQRIDPRHAATEAFPGRLQNGDTTYLNVVDRDGAMVSLIQSVSSAFGSGIVGGDTGVVLNNRAGRGFSLEDGHVNQYAPGKKTMHTLNCYLIADTGGRPVLVGGTPGGDGQPQWNLQAVVAMIDGQLDAQAAIELPRWTSWPGTDPATVSNAFELRIEDRMPPDIVDGLKERGHLVRRVGPWSGGGAAQIIARDPETGTLIGGADARVESAVLGY